MRKSVRVYKTSKLAMNVVLLLALLLDSNQRATNVQNLLMVQKKPKIAINVVNNLVESKILKDIWQLKMS